MAKMIGIFLAMQKKDLTIFAGYVRKDMLVNGRICPFWMGLSRRVVPNVDGKFSIVICHFRRCSYLSNMPRKFYQKDGETAASFESPSTNNTRIHTIEEIFNSSIVQWKNISWHTNICITYEYTDKNPYKT